MTILDFIDTQTFCPHCLGVLIGEDKAEKLIDVAIEEGFEFDDLWIIQRTAEIVLGRYAEG